MLLINKSEDKSEVVHGRKNQQKIVETLDNLTLESIEAVRDQALEAAQKAEEAARNTTNLVVGDLRNRPNWKNNYGVDKLT